MRVSEIRVKQIRVNQGLGVCFFKGLCLLFFPNVPVATFIQGATLIPESRVTIAMVIYVLKSAQKPLLGTVLRYRYVI